MKLIKIQLNFRDFRKNPIETRMITDANSNQYLALKNGM